MNHLTRQARSMLRSFPRFAQNAGGYKLYKYQLTPAKAILESIRNNLGMSFVLIFPRQSGKDELLCHLKTYLMRILSYKDRGIVEVNPTYKPQTINAIHRLEDRMNKNLLTKGKWKKRSDFMRMVGSCRTSFLSGDGSANVVGATASLLLIINEAQDINPAIYDKNFAPMAASRNATRVFCGTSWTSRTLLAREKRAAHLAQERDGRQRVYLYNADDVAHENKLYQKFVASMVATHGRNHPMVKTQYFSEEIDAEISMFNPGRRGLMIGDERAHEEPLAGRLYAFALDVAGQDEARMKITDDDAPLDNAGRDSISLSTISIDLSTLSTLNAPTYRVVMRRFWTGENHLKVFGQVKALADAWKPTWFIVDASGVGEGFWSLLDRFYPGQVEPVKFTQQTKSDIGWRFISIIETGRFRNCADTPMVRVQYDNCTSEILPGPAKTLRWGVPDGTRGADGDLIHDDAVISDSLCAVLDQMEWSQSEKVDILNPIINPLDELGKLY